MKTGPLNQKKSSIAFGGRPLQLERPSLELLSSYLEFIEQMRTQGEKIWDTFVPAPTENGELFVRRLLLSETRPAVGLVPESTFWATKNREVVGRISLRHTLTDNLKEIGGHIGYEVKPSVRRNGIATEMLRLMLLLPKAHEIGRLLLTCSPDNLASNRTILCNGGVLEKTAFVKSWNRFTNYYWITITR